MKHIAYILTMPGVGSWNGSFTGSRNFYCVTRSYKNSSHIPAKVLSMESGYIYDFGDGWVSRIKAREIPVVEKPVYNSQSSGFMGYEWMIKEIEKYGRIRTLKEKKFTNE